MIIRLASQPAGDDDAFMWKSTALVNFDNEQWTLGRNFGEQFLRKSTKRWQKWA